MAGTAVRLAAVFYLAAATFGSWTFGAEFGYSAAVSSFTARGTTAGFTRNPSGGQISNATSSSATVTLTVASRSSPAAATSAAPARPSAATPAATPTDIKIEAGYCDGNGRCTCSVSFPQPCSADYQYREILAVKERIREVDTYLNGSFIRNIALNVTSIMEKLRTLEESVNKRAVSVSLVEIDGLRKELSSVSSWLSTLVGKVERTVMESLTTELAAILQQIEALEQGNPVAAQGELEKQLEELRARLARCKEESASLTSTPFPGDAARLNETNFRTCSKSVDLKVGPQVTHKWRSGLAFSWLRDAGPSDINKTSAIYEIRQTQNTNVPLHEWSIYGDYSSARSEYLFKTKCSFPISGRKHVLLDGFLYYFDYQTTLVSKLDTRTCKVTQTLKLPVEQSAVNKYLHGEPTYADINYDETGMYVAYTAASYTGELVITKIDPVNMTAVKTWETGRLKSTLGNVFFVCGRMYTTDSYNVRHLTGKQFGYDTNVGSEFLVNMDVESRLGSVVQLAYNPRDRMIFGVDNSHAVSYDVYLV